jgi:hypothetical protein
VIWNDLCCLWWRAVQECIVQVGVARIWACSCKASVFCAVLLVVRQRKGWAESISIEN